MNQTGKCPKCACRRLLFVDNFKGADGVSAEPLSLCVASSPGGMRAGGLKAIVCLGCGFLEWYALRLDEVTQSLGELFPAARVVDGDFTDAAQALGLTVDKASSIGGFHFFARGIHQDVPMTIGQRVRPRMTEWGIVNVLRIEVMVTATSNLGSYAVRRQNAVGLEPNVRYGQVARTGEPAFDAAFLLSRLGPVDPGDAALGLERGIPVIRIPWLDSTVSGAIVAASPEEILVTGKSVGMLLVDYRPEQFAHAVDLAVSMAKWSPGSEHPYR